MFSKLIVVIENLYQESNNNVMKVIRYSSNKRLVLSSIQFQRKYIYKYTWIAPDGKNKNQIDHVVIEKIFNLVLNL